MGREARGGNAGRAVLPEAARAAPGSRKNRRYGAVTPSTPLDRNLTFDHMVSSEQGYCSLAGRAEDPPSGGEGAGAGAVATILRRLVVGGIVVTLFAAAVSTLYGGDGGRASSETGVVGAWYPKMAAEVRALR